VVATNPDVKALSDDVIASLQDPNPSAFDRARMGLQLYDNNSSDAWAAALDRVGQTKVGWIKIQVNWASLQPDGPGGLGGTIDSFDSALAAARGRGLRVMLSIAKAPGWARGGNSDGSGPPDDPQMLGDFITLLLARVGGNVNAIEVWNEPNLRGEWNLAALPFDGGGYMQLFQPAYKAIRAYSPTMTIITAGLAPTYTSERSVDDRTYLRQMYAAGLASMLDVVIGVHPYGWGNSAIARCCDPVDDRGWDDNSRFFFLQTLEEYRSIQLENTHDVQLWVTEFGWATWEGLPGDPPEGWMAYNTPVDQSNHTLRAFQLAQRLPYVGPMMLWNLNFGTTTAVAGRSSFAGYSLLFENGTMRPLFGSLVPTS
jgi:polysaccharide biosynthesis protein PslG